MFIESFSALFTSSMIVLLTFSTNIGPKETRHKQKCKINFEDIGAFFAEVYLVCRWANEGFKMRNLRLAECKRMRKRVGAEIENFGRLWCD